MRPIPKSVIREIRMFIYWRPANDSNAQDETDFENIGDRMVKKSHFPASKQKVLNFRLLPERSDCSLPYKTKNISRSWAASLSFVVVLLLMMMMMMKRR